MISIIIPAYNEAQNIEGTIKEIVRTVGDKTPTISFEIVVVDDHSDDELFHKVELLGLENVKCMRLSKRSGSFTALRAGFRFASGDAVLFMAADGQDDPSIIAEMVTKWEKGSDVVWAFRKNRKDETFLVKVPAIIFYKILRCFLDIGGRKVNIANADFFLIDRKVVDAVNALKEKSISLYGMIIWSGFKHNFVEYVRRERNAGQSKWNFKTRLGLAVDWIFSFSNRPVNGIFLLSAIMVVCSAALACLLICNVSTSRTLLPMLIFVICLAQAICFCVIGEYLKRTFDEVLDRPLFFIEKMTGNMEANG